MAVDNLPCELPKFCSNDFEAQFALKNLQLILTYFLTFLTQYDHQTVLD